MKNYMKTILSGIQNWTKKEIQDSTADWNQNDSSADNYVKNRTHWEEKIFGTFVDNLTSEEYTNGNVPSCNFIVGESYTVIWNDKTYDNLICYTDGEFNIIASPDNGCPFYIDDDGGNGLFIGPVEDEEKDFTVSILGNNAIVHTLDVKYMPEELNEAFINIDNSFGEVWNAKMNKSNPIGTGSFSINRKASTTNGIYSVAIGYNTTASGDYSYAEGINTTASGIYSHAEGKDTIASNGVSHAEGTSTTASGYNSHAEGSNTTASGSLSHAEGGYTTASGNYSHSEGGSTTASGDYSHVEGRGSKASGDLSHSEGYFTIAASSYQHAQGKYNLQNSDGTLVHIVGNGTSVNERSNAHTLDWEGNAWYSGDVYVGSTSGTNKDDGSKKLITLDEVKPVSLPLFDTWYSLEDGTTIDYIEGYTFNTYYDSLLNHPATQIVIGQDEMDVPIPNGSFAYIANETLTVTHIDDSNIYLQLLLPYNNAILLFVLSTDHIYVRVINIIDGLATEEYVNTSIANLVDSAPETLNTLNELATAIQENDSVITTLDAAITNKITMPQDVVAGDLLTYDGTNWVRISKADLIAEIIAALPNAEEASF